LTTAKNWIDYRYPRRIVDVMQRFRPGIPYDQFILAGASLGACNPEWQRVLVQHVKVALKLGHDIQEIVILDHRDCGAYKHPREAGVPEAILRDGLPDDVLPSVETACHQHVLSNVIPALRKRMRKKIPDVKFSAWLLTREEDDPLVVT
jgi:hypothetical protein